MSRRRKTMEWGKDPRVERAKQKAKEMESLAQRDLELATRPERHRSPPDLPDDLSEFTDNDLTNEMTLYTRWADYLEVELALAEVHERGCEHIVEVIEAQRLIKHWGGTSTDRVNIAKAHSEVDEEVRDAKDQLQVAYARRKLITTMFHRAERAAALLSRELSRRLEMEPKQRRSDWRST